MGNKTSKKSKSSKSTGRGDKLLPETVKCEHCGSDVIVMGKGTTHWYSPVDPALDALSYGCPHTCGCCTSIHTEYQPIRDIIVVWSINKYAPQLYESVIIVPETTRIDEPSDIGLVLAVGPGYRDVIKSGPKDKVGKLTTVDTSFLEKGMVVCYDRTVPWNIPDQGLDGQFHHITFCGYRDVYGIVPNPEAYFLPERIDLG